MSVSRNPFSALDEDYNPNAPVEEAQPKVPNTAPKEIVAKQTTSKKRDPSRQTAGESRRGGEYVPRGGRSGKPRDSSNTNDAPPKDKLVGHDANAANSVEDTVARGTARGRGRGRGSGNRREYDRRNASGKTDTAKATEQSWGNEAEAQQSATAEPIDVKDPAAPDSQETGAEVSNAIPEEEEDNTVSYEDYLKQKAEKALSVSALSIRQANEGADDSKWANQKFSREGEKEDYFAGIQKSGKGSSQKERKQKETLELEQRFYQAPSTRGRGTVYDPIRTEININSTGEGRGRGGRGSGRGRGAPRGDSRAPTRGKATSSHTVDLSLNDDSAFPSLS